MKVWTMTALFVSLAAAGATEPPVRTSGGQLFAAPRFPAEQPAWLESLKRWRSTTPLDRALYDDPKQAWTRRSVVQSLVLAQERTLYDPKSGRYTVDRYLDDVTARYGGVDSVIIWHTYPNIGIDDRNQHDHLRDMPGGLPGLRKMVADFHKRGVRVLFPIMPWDAGTRPEGSSLAAVSIRDLKAIGADGIFGDTLNGIDRSFLEAAETAGIPLVLEPELNLGADGMAAWNTTTWGQFWDDAYAPGISAYKWLEPRHMVHVTSRWSKDRSGDLQRAFLNGTGYESWENVWGLWNGIAGRDAASLRRIAAIEREFSGILAGAGWEPYAAIEPDGVFASRFAADGMTLWTIVNRTDKAVSARVLKVPFQPGMRYYDLWAGAEIPVSPKEGAGAVSVTVPAHGFGSVLAAPGKTSPALRRFLGRTAALPAIPNNAEWKVLPQRMTPIEATKPAASAPPGMVPVPAGTFEFRVSGVEIEGSDEFGIDVQYPWEDAPRRGHSRTMRVPAFYVDRTPVTNAEFRRFLDAAKYRPRDAHNFLRHWSGGTYPEGWANKPVIWVSLEDARAYAKWAGKRLPHEWEWQYAAQGTDGRAFPWGPEPNAAAMPPPDSGHAMRPPAFAGAFPAGASPFGALDMVGNVWQWTDEFVDDHTRAAVLRGGSYYRPTGSDWYFPQAHRLDQHGKYLLMSPGKDRSGAIGFRCIVDAAPSGEIR